MNVPEPEPVPDFTANAHARLTISNSSSFRLIASGLLKKKCPEDTFFPKSTPSMKKLLSLACFFIFSSILHALPLGNPLSPSFLYDAHNPYWAGNCCPNTRYSFGFYGDYIFDRHLRTRRAFPERHADKTRIMTNAAILNLDFFQRASVFTTVGSTQISMRAARTVFSFPPPILNEMVFIDANPAISWSIGARGILYECGCFTFGLESQYFATWPAIHTIRSEGIRPFYVKNRRINYWEFQIGFGAAYNYCIGGIGRISPYAGFKWSILNLHMTRANKDTLTFGDRSYILRDFENARDIGLCLGLSLALYETWVASVEGNFSDENALSVNVRIRF